MMRMESNLLKPIRPRKYHRMEDYQECLDKMYGAFLDWGWSDGFPVIPARKDAVNGREFQKNREEEVE